MGHISILLLDHENMKGVNSVKTEHTKNIENQKMEGKIQFDDICVMIKMLEVNFYFYFIIIIIFFCRFEN